MFALLAVADADYGVLVAPRPQSSSLPAWPDLG
jgi:hypothetical protein